MLRYVAALGVVVAVAAGSAAAGYFSAPDFDLKNHLHPDSESQTLLFVMEEDYAAYALSKGDYLPGAYGVELEGKGYYIYANCGEYADSEQVVQDGHSYMSYCEFEFAGRTLAEAKASAVGA